MKFHGRDIPAEGSIAASLLRAGEDAGVFCAIGICFGCLVTVNDGPPVRGCLTAAAPGDEVRRHDAV